MYPQQQQHPSFVPQHHPFNANPQPQQQQQQPQLGAPIPPHHGYPFPHWLPYHYPMQPPVYQNVSVNVPVNFAGSPPVTPVPGQHPSSTAPDRGNGNQRNHFEQVSVQFY